MNESPRIEIEPDGPYVVYGDVALKEMAPVHTFNGEPVDWHTLREIPVAQRPFELCRCGQSANKPFCDKSHRRVGFDGYETADRSPFLERAQGVTNGVDAIVDDKVLCMSAGFCGTRTTTVWKLLEVAAQDPEKRELMRDMIWRCPTGRLVLVDAQSGTAIEPELPPEVAVLPGGPIWVRGGIEIVGSDGEPWELRNRVTLCRCGASANKPFCDSTHARIKFDER
jgi:CDGSH-type Zn-finger protein